MKTACVTLVALLASAQAEPAPAAFPTARWDALLVKYVDDAGRVRYRDVDKAEVDRLCAVIAASSPASSPKAYPTRASKEAYYLDAYNLLVWKSVLDRLPKMKSVDDVKASFFDDTKHLVGGKAMSLTDLESVVIRPSFRDPRVHMALNCASAGCPELPAKAFTADALDAQLDRETRKFVAAKRNVEVAGATVRLSRIFDWYKDDFGPEPAQIIGWINRYRTADAQVPASSRVVYVDYDWRLNDERLVR